MPVSPVRQWARAAAGVPAINGGLRRLAAARGRSLVLIYHRVGRPGTSPAVVPWLPADLFRAQIEALADVGDLVPLADLLRPAPPRGRPRFALTFDDDYRSHASTVAPILEDLGVPATFFLSGRCLHNLGHYWWETLESLVATQGITAAARLLGLPEAPLEMLALQCERNPELQGLLGDHDAAPSAEHVDAAQIRRLASPPFTVGFHTLHHPDVTQLEDASLARAMDEGRQRLSEHIGAAVELFAYPHGKADPRAAAAARAAGYAAAFTGQPRAIGRGADPHLLGRWEVGDAPVDRLLVGAATRLNRPARASR